MSIEVHSEIFPIMNWFDALELCARLGDGWRLPTLEELNGISMRQKPGDFCCWSSSIWEEDNTMVWAKELETGRDYLRPKSDHNRVLVVKKLFADRTYWSSEIPHPLSPSEDDVQIFRENLLPGTVLLLGYTKRLIPLSDRQLDIDPLHLTNTIIIGEWTENKHFYTNIILDGGLCFTKELCDKILEMASGNCRRFISRSFAHRLDIMRIADYFPRFGDFHIQPSHHRAYPDYNFFIWDFK